MDRSVSPALGDPGPPICDAAPQTDFPEAHSGSRRLQCGLQPRNILARRHIHVLLLLIGPGWSRDPNLVTREVREWEKRQVDIWQTLLPFLRTMAGHMEEGDWVGADSVMVQQITSKPMGFSAEFGSPGTMGLPTQRLS